MISYMIPYLKLVIRYNRTLCIRKSIWLCIFYIRW